MVVELFTDNSGLILFSALPAAVALLTIVYSVYSAYSGQIAGIRQMGITLLLIFLLGLVLFVELREFWDIYTTTAEYGTTTTEGLRTVISVVTALSVSFALTEIHSEPESDDELKLGSFQPGSQKGMEELFRDLEERNEKLESHNDELENSVSKLQERVSELEERNTRLEQRNTELEVYGEMVNSVPDILFALDEKWQFIEANEATSKMLGYDYDDILGMRFSSLMSAEGDPDIDIKSEEQKVLVEHHVNTKDSETYPIELHMARLSPTKGASKGIVGMGRDITWRKEREQRLEVINRFFRHNIRNELTVVIGRTEMLINRLSGDDKEIANMVRERAEVLKDMSEKARVVGDILSGRPERTPVKVSEAIERAVAEFEDEDLELRVDMLDDVEVRVIDGLHFAVENLVENAIEHNDIENLIVEIDVYRQEGEVVIQVADNGSGIPQHEIDVVQEGDEDALKHGSGIGLWAVNWIVQLSRGRLDFGESELGGASVKMTFQEHSS